MDFKKSVVKYVDKHPLSAGSGIIVVFGLFLLTIKSLFSIPDRYDNLLIFLILIVILITIFIYFSEKFKEK